MFLSEVFDQLSVGEFANLSIGGVDSIGIQECDFSKVIPHVKLGLTELYKRFPLRIKEVIVQQYDQIQEYQLNIKYAATNAESTEPIKYIIDSPENPFTDNVLRIDAVYNEGGEELFLNDSSEVWSIYTSAYDTIFTPYPMGNNNFSIKYRADHDPLPSVGLDPQTTTINVPPGLLEALLYYIAARVYTNLNTDGSLSDGNNFMQKFELSCKKVEELSLINKDMPVQTRLEQNGWV